MEKTITMSLSEYELLLEENEKTKQSIEMNMVCKSSYPPRLAGMPYKPHIEWFGISEKLKENEALIETLESEIEDFFNMSPRQFKKFIKKYGVSNG